ncbi:response regulator transcription factor [Mechercharimyces sp. CAU 1602]|uniref:response regulator n=1 Tax=Mechercharimyces sp. CAU 1602 TaxID=2973933 RepID=UPI002162D9C1|nr:response regulator transcription factor [Mechercharimyces sp. CAU 1602]MCS1349979.1 response regulator transcription factor [Mechercharimyces sp. CAU 1602]
MIKVLVVDDHEMVRFGLVTYLATEEEIEVIGEASNGKEALPLVESKQPDIILLDLVMPKMDGVETTKAILARSPESKIIILTSYLHDDKLFPVIEAGAFSYLLKTSSAEEIIDAIHAATKGDARIDPQVAHKLMNRMKRSAQKPTQQISTLTPRELEVLALLGKARTNQQIAEELYIGIKTVKTHVSNILAKLNLEDRTQAALYAVNNDLLSSK